MTPEEMESLKRSIEDALAGRVTPLSDVLAELGIEEFESQMNETSKCECSICEGCDEERHEGLMSEGEPCPSCPVHDDPSQKLP